MKEGSRTSRTLSLARSTLSALAHWSLLLAWLAGIATHRTLLPWLLAHALGAALGRLLERAGSLRTFASFRFFRSTVAVARHLARLDRSLADVGEATRWLNRPFARRCGRSITSLGCAALALALGENSPHKNTEIEGGGEMVEEGVVLARSREEAVSTPVASPKWLPARCWSTWRQARAGTHEASARKGNVAGSRHTVGRMMPKVHMASPWFNSVNVTAAGRRSVEIRREVRRHRSGGDAGCSARPPAWVAHASRAGSDQVQSNVRSGRRRLDDSLMMRHRAQWNSENRCGGGTTIKGVARQGGNVMLAGETWKKS